ncbi:Bug family tripartite tricarboxylate transporter substrate binding protein [Bordetella tumbae]|uniref:Bug family tripartite tricarboxylate transporter substrate binding protein n=1 Tax=Bordetella tumbae TaxID=1649139 RepID=UPI0039EF3BCC
MNRRSFVQMALALPAASLPAWARAAAYPGSKPIHMIVPFAAAGNVDTMARLVGAAMGPLLGTSIVVENRAGVGGGIGAGYVTRSKPDGYTLLASSNGPLTVNLFFQKNMTYDPLKDLIPLGKISDVAHVLAVNPSLPAKTLPELIKLSQQRPINVGTSGVGSATHMTLVRFVAATGANLTHVPYKGGGALTADLVGGTLDAAFTELSTAQPLHKSGMTRIMAIAAQNRSPLVPDVPTAIEQGVADFIATSYVGLLVPAGTPEEVRNLVQQALAKSLDDTNVTSNIRNQGAEVAIRAERTGAGFGAFLRGEFDRSKAAVQQAGIVPE